MSFVACMRMMCIASRVPTPTNEPIANGLLTGLLYDLSLIVEALHELFYYYLLIVEVKSFNVITIAVHSMIGEDVDVCYPTALSASKATTISSFRSLYSSSTSTIQSHHYL